MARPNNRKWSLRSHFRYQHKESYEPKITYAAKGDSRRLSLGQSLYDSPRRTRLAQEPESDTEVLSPRRDKKNVPAEFDYFADNNDQLTNKSQDFKSMLQFHIPTLNF